MANKPVDPVVLREFVSAVKDATASKKPEKEYMSGVVTHTDIDGTVWVNVAGGVNDMPVTRSTASYSPGDVVSFSIENGVASIGGNASDPAAPISKQVTVEKRVLKTEETVEKIGNVVAEKADIAELRAARADISQLQAADVTITGRLNAAEGDITDLKAKDITIEGNLTAATGRIGTIEADYLKAADMQAETARVDNLLAGKASVADLQAVNGEITNLKAEDATINGKLTAAEGDIDTLQANTADIATIRANAAKVQNLTAAELEADHAKVGALDTTYATIDNLNAATGRIGTLEANTADIATIRANSAKVKDVTAQQITAATGYISDLTAGNVTAANIISDHAAVGSLDANYAQIDMANVNNAWISNGTIKDGAISSAMINDLSANKLTAGTINGSVINVTNLNANNITTGTINGQRIGAGSLSLDKLSEDVYTESEVDAKLSTMQQQIDGAIETWTGTVEPTLNNVPASGWTTAADRDKHVGDVYFNTSNGYNYRFTKTGSVYSWQLIRDTDITNALQRLSTAEGKITTFDSDISTLKTDTGTLKTKTTSLETRMSDAESDILDKVDTTTFNEVSDTVDSHTESIQQMTQTISNKADSSTVTSLTTRVNKNETDISGINTTIGELQTTVASKADGSALTTVSNKLNTVSDTVDGHTQTISSVQSTLATKADNSTVNTLRSEYNETKTTVAGHETRLGATESVANGVRTDLDNLEIGGRNLLKGTADITGDVGGGGVVEWGTDSMFGGVKTAKTQSSWSGIYMRLVNIADAMVAGEKYTASVYVKTDEDRDVPFTAYRFTHKTNVDDGSLGTHSLKAGVWEQLSITFTATEGDDSSKTTSKARIESSQAVPLWWAALKLERGTKPTDWTPAPEDLETEVTTLKTDYATYKQTTTESLTQIGTRMTTAEGKISTAETNIASNANAISLKASQSEVDTLTDRVASAESSISVQAGQISSKVSQSDFNDLEGRVDTAESTIEQQAGQIEAKVSKNGVIAAINLSTETEGGSTAKIRADKVNITGTAIFSALGSSNKVVTATQTQWYSSTSATSKSGGSWGTSQPSVVAGRYIWQREYLTYSDGSHEYKPSEAGVCIQGQTDLSDYAQTSDIPTKVSELQNDSGFQNSTQVNAAITGKGYQTASQVNSAITSKGYATTTQAQGYANTAESNAKAAIPTKVSQLNNDSSFATTTQVSTAKSEAISAAATDATSKANAALGNAKTYVDGKGYQTASDVSGIVEGYGYATEDYADQVASTAAKNVAQNWFATCSTAAGTKDKVATITPTTTDFQLKAGVTVNVKFTNNNSYSATAANPITLNVNGSGAKNIYYANSATPTGTNTTAFGRANYTNTYVYDGSHWVWVSSSADNNSDTYNRVRWQNAIKVLAKPTGTWRILCGTSAGYTQVATGVSFDLAYPILTPSNQPEAGATTDAAYTCVNSMTFTNTAAVESGTANSVIYLKGKVSGNTFTIDSTTVFTCKVPTSADGYFYIPLGVMYSATAGYFQSSKDLYAFIDGKFRQVTPTEIVATHRVYYRTATANSSLAAPIAWVEEATGNVYNQWTTKVPPLSTDKTDTTATKYLYLYTCEQRKRLDGTVECTKVLLDENATIIDGGNIITGSIAANKLDANSVKADIVQTTDLAATQIKSGDISADRIKANVIGAINSLSAGQIDAARIRVDQITVGQEQVEGLDDDLTDLSNSIQQTSESLSDKLDTELGSFVPDKEKTMEVWGKLTAEEIDVDKLRGFLLQAASLILGNPDAVHIDASGAEMAFMNGLDKVAYIDAATGTFYMTKSVVLDDMYFGDGKWKWYKRSNNNMSVKWVG